MWNPFDEIKEKIVITKASLLKYAEVYRKFRKDMLIKDLIYIHKLEFENDFNKKDNLIKQVELKLNYLVEKGFLKVEGDFIFISN